MNGTAPTAGNENKLRAREFARELRKLQVRFQCKLTIDPCAEDLWSAAICVDVGDYMPYDLEELHEC